MRDEGGEKHLHACSTSCRDVCSSFQNDASRWARHHHHLSSSLQLQWETSVWARDIILHSISPSHAELPSSLPLSSSLFNIKGFAKDRLWTWHQSVRWRTFFSVLTLSKFTRQSWTKIFLQQNRPSTILLETWWLLICTGFMINTARNIIITNNNTTSTQSEASEESQVS